MDTPRSVREVAEPATREYSILFVDDDEYVRRSLNRFLSRQRRGWRLAFADCVESAEACLAEASFDVIVADLRMPGTDGITFLRNVAQTYPDSVRVMLSGSAGDEAIRAVPVAHQFVAKPWDTAMLVSTLERACEMKSLVSPQLREVIGGIRNLPSLPAVYLELQDLVESPSASLRDIANVVESDMAICARVLQVVNSAFFSPARRVANIDEAVRQLGISAIRDLVLTEGIFRAFRSMDAAPGFSLEAEHDHSLNTARIATKIIASRPPPGLHAAALLHDLGALVIGTHLKDAYVAIRAASAKHGWTLIEAERAILGVTHAEIGAYLLGIWGVPTEIVLAVRDHHLPRVDAHGHMSLTSIVHIASAIADTSSMDEAPVVSQSYCDQLGVTPLISEWQRHALGA